MLKIMKRTFLRLFKRTPRIATKAINETMYWPYEETAIQETIAMGA
jgi:hypothetical protein